MVQGLLQTADYSRAVIQPALPHHAAEEIDRLVELRRRRQNAFRRRGAPPLEMVALIDEVVLRRPVGGPAVMVAQLDRLLEVAQWPNVEIRIMPVCVGILRAHAGHFVVLEIPPELGSGVVYIEGHAGDFYLDTPSDLRLYEEVFADALGRSLSPPHSVELMTRYRARHRHPERQRGTPRS